MLPVTVFLATLKDWSTLVAAFQSASPDCEARTVTVPAPVTVTVLPETVAGPETMLNVTVNPDEALAATVNGASP